LTSFISSDRRAAGSDRVSGGRLSITTDLRIIGEKIIQPAARISAGTPHHRAT
jgi:hypothetical protein